MSAALPPAVRRHRSASGGFSRRLVSLSGFTGRWIRRDLKAFAESLRLLGYAIVEALSMVGFVVTTLLSTRGWVQLGPSFTRLQRNAERQRAWASKRLGRHLTTQYREAADPSKSAGLAPLAVQLQDQSRARDVDWHLANPIATLLGAAIPWALLIHGWVIVASCVGGVLTNLPSLSWGGNGGPVVWYGDIAIYTGYGTLQIALLGTAAILLGGAAARLIQRLHARWVSYMLATDSSGELQERVETLTQTRKTALELQEAEIQRIERDLHDGAQARLVTMGMTLTQVERLLEHDPVAARGLLAAAKGDSAAALKELRHLVRGIRPPVLADRGLADALRSLAATSPIDTRVVSRLPGRLVPTLETALYFAVVELLANATKHSAASEVVIELEADDTWVTSRVTDNGIGGAEETDDGGLAGIRRRLGAFDGHLDVISPVGGPTVATVTVPTPSSEG